MQSVLRNVLTLPTTVTRLSAVFPKRFVLDNIIVARSRAFSVSTRTAFANSSKRLNPTVKKATKTTSTTTKKAPAKKTPAKKTTSKASAAKKKPTTRKAAPKRKVAAKKKVTVKKRAKPKKVVPKKVTPRTDASLRPPPRGQNAFSLFIQRLYPTLSPKPANASAGMPILKNMWSTLTEAEKKPYEDEAEALSAERRVAYDKWRANLSASDVRTINAYRTKTKGHKLGPPPSSGKAKRPLSPYMKFFQESLKNGKIDRTKAPEGTRFVIYASKEAGKLWKGMSDAAKKAYEN